MSRWQDVVAIVPGGSNTDLVISGAPAAAPGQLAVGGRFTVGPGGKSRNVAQMMAAYIGPGRVAFLGRTLAQPPEGFTELDRLLADPARGEMMPHVYALLAQVPLAALRRSGVVTDFVAQVPYVGLAGGVAEILVGPSGENTIYLAPGLNAEFSPADVDAAAPLFEAVGRRGGGILPLALEIPLRTAAHAARKAREHSLVVVLDPGGITAASGVSEELREVLRLADIVKPNEHEARLLTGVEVVGDDSASEAARRIAGEYGPRHVIITAGARGAWHWSDAGATFYPACAPPEIRDTTGCGDQFMAVLCCHLAAEPSAFASAMRHAVVAAGLQAARVGIQPVPRSEVTERLGRGAARRPPPSDA